MLAADFCALARSHQYLSVEISLVCLDSHAVSMLPQTPQGFQILATPAQLRCRKGGCKTRYPWRVNRSPRVMGKATGDGKWREHLDGERMLVIPVKNVMLLHWMPFESGHCQCIRC